MNVVDMRLGGVKYSKNFLSFPIRSHLRTRGIDLVKERT